MKQKNIDWMDLSERMYTGEKFTRSDLENMGYVFPPSVTFPDFHGPQATRTQATQGGEGGFQSLLTACENAIIDGRTDGQEVLDLAQAVAFSVIKKLTDPQAGKAPVRETVSDNGQNPEMIALRRGLAGDISLLKNQAATSEKAFYLLPNDDGDMIRRTASRADARAFDALDGNRLSDGIDLYNTAVLSILECAEDIRKRSGTLGAGWLSAPYTVRKLSGHIIIKKSDSVAWADVETTAIQEIYRAVRETVQKSRAVQTDPRNGYSYLEEVLTDPQTGRTETGYIRLDKYADMGGEDCNGLYTVPDNSPMDYNRILSALGLSDRQASVVSLRLRGYGHKAIGTYLGVDVSNVKRTIKQVRKKAEKVGFTPEMWAEMTGRTVAMGRGDYTPASRAEQEKDIKEFTQAYTPAPVADLGKMDYTPAHAELSARVQATADSRKQAEYIRTGKMIANYAFRAERIKKFSESGICLNSCTPAPVRDTYMDTIHGLLHPAPVGTYAGTSLGSTTDPAPLASTLDETEVNGNRDKRRKALALEMK